MLDKSDKEIIKDIEDNIHSDKINSLVGEHFLNEHEDLANYILTNYFSEHYRADYEQLLLDRWGE